MGVSLSISKNTHTVHVPAFKEKNHNFLGERFHDDNDKNNILKTTYSYVYKIVLQKIPKFMTLKAHLVSQWSRLKI